MKKWVLKVFSASAALTLLVTATIPLIAKCIRKLVGDFP